MLKVYLIAHTPMPEKVVSAAAKMCYSDAGADALLDGMTDEAADRFLHMLSELGHESPIEHASFTFAIEGVSRSLLAQITRHRIASFSVQSQRYVRKDAFEYVVPPEIAKNEEALSLYKETMDLLQQRYDRLAEILSQQRRAEFEAQGLSDRQVSQKAEKAAIEDARYVLPNACETKMIMTMNTRSLLNFFRLRCCNRAQWEIRELAWQMLALCRRAAPALFEKAGPACLFGPCSEGKMTCGRADEVRRRGDACGR
ncbi:MAG TPA: FAD-dependent thymidylate synthase [Candidatus Ventrousia excrementavium]|uniref:Flavin-dependent thymidylate synthase n=1 Tax=Candidatus Ventrousia excrementavium TaxID=2840961 RepID=A0A9D1IVJ3_9CLOT|nr:FAD-dependent thymidylate synthase [Candidatus Ventrousia excrementavium]